MPAEKRRVRIDLERNFGERDIRTVHGEPVRIDFSYKVFSYARMEKVLYFFRFEPVRRARAFINGRDGSRLASIEGMDLVLASPWRANTTGTVRFTGRNGTQWHPSNRLDRDELRIVVPVERF